MTVVREPAGDDELRAALALRHEVFVVEQGVPLADELDGLDDHALHLVAVEDGRVTGTCRLLPDGDALRLGRMAVAPAARGRGVATALLRAAEDRARAAGAARVVLAAQAGVEPLYAAAGYAAEGDRFLDAGIEHVTMSRAL